MKFEWDESKNRRNFAKHKINFELASKVFDDPLIKYIQDRVVDGEERWRAVGHVMNHFLIVVVHCYRSDENGDEIVRIISARVATSHERRAYEEG